MFSPANFKKSLIKWIIIEDQPFTAIESEQIHDIFRILNPAAATTMSADTIHNGVMKAFTQEREKLQQILQV